MTSGFILSWMDIEVDTRGVRRIRAAEAGAGSDCGGDVPRHVIQNCRHGNLKGEKRGAVRNPGLDLA